MIKFEMDDNLLKNVIFKQAGTLEKAILECFQNSIDAGCTEIKININCESFLFHDNGIGMNSNVIDSNFKVFGNSSKKGNSEKIGKFGIGRGQLFAFGSTVWKTNDFSLFINAKKRLSFVKRKLKQKVKGTKISCMLYEKLDSYQVERLISNIKNMIIPDTFKLFINDKEIVNSFVLIDKNDFFELFDNDYEATVFAQNLRVKTLYSTYNYRINCLNQMNLNFARNEFIENDDMTIKLNEFIKDTETNFTIERKKFDSYDALKILKKVSRNEIDVKKVMDKKIIELINGKFISLNELNNQTDIIFSEKNRLADKCLESGYTVITECQDDYLDILLTEKVITYTVHYRKCNEIFPESSYQNINIKEIESEKEFLRFCTILDMNKEIFNENRVILLGKSNSAIAWTDGYNEITFNISILEISNTSKFLSQIYETLIHEYAHCNNSFDIVDHAGTYNAEYRDLNVKYISKFLKFSNNHSFKKIKENYSYEIDDYTNDKSEYNISGKKVNILLEIIKQFGINSFTTKDINEISNLDYHNQIKTLTVKGIIDIVKISKKLKFYKITTYGLKFL